MEFYVPGPGGNASGYPTNRTVNEMGVRPPRHREPRGRERELHVRVDLAGVQVIYNRTAHANESVEVN